MIHSTDRFGTTWWGRLWIRALELLGDDYENRLPRGRPRQNEQSLPPRNRGRQNRLASLLPRRRPSPKPLKNSPSQSGSSARIPNPCLTPPRRSFPK